jgi:transposase-like protein
MKHKPRSEFWREQIRLAAEFEGTATEYCRRHDLNLPVFYSWRKKLRADAKDKSPALSPFVSVEVVPERANRLPDPKWLAEFVLRLHGVQL